MSQGTPMADDWCNWDLATTLYMVVTATTVGATPDDIVIDGLVEWDVIVGSSHLLYLLPQQSYLVSLSSLRSLSLPTDRCLVFPTYLT